MWQFPTQMVSCRDKCVSSTELKRPIRKEVISSHPQKIELAGSSLFKHIFSSHRDTMC
jgi:hypothetical protein